MRNTTTSEEMKELRSEAVRREGEARILERVGGLDPAASARREEAERLQGEADKLRPAWRLENLKVYQVAKTKTTAKGEVRTYHFWNASWREEGRVRTVYLGSARRLSEEEAMQKARRLKADALGI